VSQGTTPSETTQAPRLQAAALRRGIRLFVFIAVGAAIAVIALTASRDTLAGLARVRPLWLVLTAGLWLLATLADGTRLAVLSRVSDHPMTPRISIDILLTGYFMAAVTPFQVGGLPLQLYIMSNWGIPPGKASAILLARGIMFYALLFAAAPVVALTLGVSTVLLKVMAGYILVIVAGGATLILAGIFFPRRMAGWQVRLAARPKQTKLVRLAARFLAEFLHLTEGLKLYLLPRNLGLLGVALVLTVVYGLAYFSMSGTLLAGLGVATDFPRVIGLNLILTAVLLFMPTPGAGGVAEAGAAALYSMICPKHMLGVFVVVWRVFSFYLGAILGGMTALRHTARLTRPVAETSGSTALTGPARSDSP
jgi:hypothetical protein